MAAIVTFEARRRVVDQLAAEIGRCETARWNATEGNVVSSGCDALDRLMPRGGFARGSLVEWIAGCHGSGAMILALAVARAACGEEGYLAVIDSEKTFFPPAAAALGMRLQNMFLIRASRPFGSRRHASRAVASLTDSEGDVLWAADQAFRCEAVSAVLVQLDTLTSQTARRWQLAAEASRVLGLLVRPRRALKERAWSEARFLVQPRASNDNSRKAAITLVHARGSWGGKTIEVSIHANPNAKANVLAPGESPWAGGKLIKASIHDESETITTQHPPHRVRVVPPLARAAASA